MRPAAVGTGTTPTGRVRAALAARPKLTAAGWAALWMLPLLAQAGRSAGVAASAAAALTAAPLLVRHRWPLAVLGAVGLLAGLSRVAFEGRPVFPVVLVLLAVHALALRQSGRRLQLVVAATALALLALVVAAAVRRGGGPATSALESPFLLGSLLAGAVLLGVNTRVRRAHLAWLEERAQRLEVERDQRARIAVVAERAQIARELHDVVAHSLTVIVRLADGIAAQAVAAPARPPDPTALAAVSSTGRQALTEMRRLLDVLREDDAGSAAGARLPQPGAEQLEPLLDRVRQTGARVTLTRQGDSSGWSAGTSLAVHRIVQEALTNVLKHAGPGASARVSLLTSGGRLEVVVDDDGRGAPVPGGDPGPEYQGRGLTGMRERAASFGGALEAGPRPTGGWRVRAELDIDRVAVAAGEGGR